MSFNVDKYKSSVRENKPIVYNGLAFKPLTVRQFALYQAAKQSYELMQSSLPPKLAVLSWCNCLDTMDRIAQEDGKKTAFLQLALIVLIATLGLEPIRTNTGDQYPLREIRDKNGNLTAILVGEINNPVILTMQDMSEIRKIIAVQNVYDIPDESWNPDLVRAQQYTASLKQNNLDVNLDDLVASVALNAGVMMSEVWGWTIRDFILCQEAIDRKLNYQIFMTAEHSGFVKFNKGNPYPTWKFNRRMDMPSSFTTVAELDAGAKGLLGITTKEVENL